MKNKSEYRIEDGSLIIDNYFNDLKIASINGGSVENILKKCKLYDEEYETFLKENEYMKNIAKDFEQLKQKNKQLKEVINKAIEKINDYKIYCEENKGFTEYTDIEIEAIEPVISKFEDILKEVSE